MFTLLLLSPSLTSGVPSSPEPTPEDGCIFAESVLKEIADEETRIYREIDKASRARQVVLTVQIRSGENLRAATKKWENENCVTY